MLTKIIHLWNLIWGCKRNHHKWHQPFDPDHGWEYNRYCLICGKRQCLVYHNYGNIRTEWITL